NFTAAKLFLRHAEEEEQMLHHSHARSLGKDGQDVETELCRELKAREDQDRLQETAKLMEPLRLVGLQPAQELEELQILNLPPQIGVPAHGVVVSQGDDVQP